MKARYVTTTITAMIAMPAAAFVPAISSGHIMSPRFSHHAHTSSRPVRTMRMAEKVDAEVVSGKSATAAKTEELIDSAKEVYDSVVAAAKDFDSSKVEDDYKALVEGFKTNTKAGVSGERGEGWAAAQLAIIFFVLLGNLPILGGSLELLAGPGLLLAGASLTVVSALQLGKNYSPWIEPADGGILMTTGVYSLCRHPLYCGLVAFSIGLGFTTDSFTRIALACLLGYVLDRMASAEEEKLSAIHPAYKTYKEEVSKFIPTIY